MTGQSTLRRLRVARSHRGQAMVEFALVAPVFFLLLFAIIEGGRFIYFYETLSHATREGARYAIVNGANSLTCSTGPAAPGSTSCDPDGSDVRQRVRDSALGMVGTAITFPTGAECVSGEADGPCWHDPANNGRGSTVTVRASYSYSSLVPLVPLPAITVEAESSLVVNN